MFFFFPVRGLVFGKDFGWINGKSNKRRSVKETRCHREVRTTKTRQVATAFSTNAPFFFDFPPSNPFFCSNRPGAYGKASSRDLLVQMTKPAD